MYIVESMIDLALPKGKDWPSETHRIVALGALLCNRLIASRDQLIEAANIINALSEEEVKKITFLELAAKGVPIPIKG